MDRMVSGAYKSEYSDGDEISKVMEAVEVCKCFQNYYTEYMVLFMCAKCF